MKHCSSCGRAHWYPPVLLFRRDRMVGSVFPATPLF
ncbi:hypothetical protein [Mesorhizobium sp. Root695]|nr:hypothetical protein [Mesorhizobium sp. Root695]